MCVQKAAGSPNFSGDCFASLNHKDQWPFMIFSALDDIGGGGSSLQPNMEPEVGDPSVVMTMSVGLTGMTTLLPRSTHSIELTYSGSCSGNI
jgi:hypothetical protein